MKIIAFILCLFLAAPAIANNDVGEYVNYCGDHIGTKAFHVAAGFTFGTLIYALDSTATGWDRREDGSIVMHPSHKPGFLPGFIATCGMGFFTKELFDIIDYQQDFVHTFGDTFIWDGGGAALSYLLIMAWYSDPIKKDFKETAWDLKVGPCSKLTYRF
jgi:hypothetical protein